MDIIENILKILDNQNNISIEELEFFYKDSFGIQIKYPDTYSNLENFLRSIPHVILKIENDELIISRNQKYGNTHFEKLIHNQKRNGKKFMVRSIYKSSNESLRVGYAKQLFQNDKKNNTYEDLNYYKPHLPVQSNGKNYSKFNTYKSKSSSNSSSNLNYSYNDGYSQTSKMSSHTDQSDASYKNFSDKKKNYSSFNRKNTNFFPKKKRFKDVIKVPKIDYKSKLINYTQANNLPEPVYKSLILSEKCYKRSATFVTKLSIGTNTWSSFPCEFTSPDLSENNVAQKALDDLKLKEQVITCNDIIEPSKNDLVDEIISILKEMGENKSLFDNIIPKLYKEKYNKYLPNNWFDIICEFPEHIKTEKFQFHNNVKTIISIPLKSNSVNDVQFDGIEKNVNILTELDNMLGSFNKLNIQELPPSLCLKDTDWTVIVIRATTSNELIIRLDDSTNAYNDLVVNLHKFYKNINEKNYVKEICLNFIYTAVFEEAVFRVQALQIEGSLVYCLFLDDGIIEKISKYKLFKIDDQFLKLPFQAFSLKLDGLETFNNGPKFKKFFDDKINETDDLLLLIARPTSLTDTIKVRLFDTSTENDVDINEELIKYLKESEKDYLTFQNFVPKAKLPNIIDNPECENENFFKVSVSLSTNPQNFIVKDANHLNDNSEFLTFNNEMQQFYNNKEPIKLNPSLIYNGWFVCVKDTDDDWYRARVESIDDCNSNITVTCYLIDIGKIIIVDFNKIQPLFSHYSEFPMIAIRASLIDVIPINEDWDAVVAYEFSQLVINKTFNAIVHHIVWLDNEPILQVSLLDLNTKKSISKYLFENNLALISNN